MAELGRTAERLGLEAALSAPVSRLLRVPGLGHSTAVMLTELEAAGVAGSIGELLAGADPSTGPRWHAPRKLKEELLIATRELLLAQEPRSRSAAPQRPRSPGALREWAREHDVLDALDELGGVIEGRLPRELRGFLHAGFATQFTVGELAAPRSPPERPLERLLQAGRDGTVLQQHAWEHLQTEAEARAGGRASEEALATGVAALTRDPAAPPSLVALARKLLEARAAVRAISRPRGPGWLTELSLVLEPDPPVLTFRATLPPRQSWRLGEPVEVRIPLEVEGIPVPRCSCRDARGPGGGSACAHALAALGEALSLLRDPARAEEVQKLAAELQQPPWSRLFRAMDTLLAKRPGSQPAAEPDARLAWRLRMLGRALDLVPYRQVRRKGGAFSKGSRLPFQELAKDPVLLATTADRRALEILAPDALAGAITPRAPSAPQTVRALSALAGHPRLFLGDDGELPLQVVEERLGLVAVPLPGGAVELKPALGGRPFPLAQLLSDVDGSRSGELAGVLDEERATFHVLTVDDTALDLLRLLEERGAQLPAEAARDLAARALSLQQVLPLALPEALKGERVDADPTLVVRLSPLGGVALALEILARPLPMVTLAAGEGLPEVFGEREGRPVHAVRDLGSEGVRARALVSKLPVRPDAEVSPLRFVLDRGEEALDLVVALAARPPGEGVVVELPEGRRVTRPAGSGDLRLQVAKKRDWLGLTGELELDGEKVQLATLLEAARRGKRYVEVRPGTFIALEGKLRERLSAAADHVFEGSSGLEVGLPALPVLEELVEGGGLLQAARELGEMLRRMREAGELNPEVPKELEATLRDYQIDGFRWLSRLASWGAGGVLADDMGLGKTLQALALLVARAGDGPALVVAPTSVCPGWISETARFAPTLKARLYRDLPSRDDALTLGPGDVLIVSYGLLTRDAERLSSARFSTLVLDEAHAVKNPGTRRARAVRKLQAGFRVALTGTPVENHLGELHSLFRAVLPGLLGSWENFRHRFAGPIEREGDPERRAALARVIRPFLLRRRKKDVAAELPPRTEVEVAVELSAAERRLYDDARLAALGQLAGLVEGGPTPDKRRFEVLAALTRLRLLACHPRLHDPRSTIGSAKLNRFLELVEELREEGHRILVFSQFVRHLTLVREALDARAISYLYLDGATPAGQRGALCAAFQAGQGELFLISLRAGGTGLNLTAADAVIHLDPWWNPAVEDQASDRAHRIGQTQPVTVLRLVTRGTIEEAILKLHGEKRALVADLLEGTDTAGKVSTAELVALIETGGGSAVEEPDETGETAETGETGEVAEPSGP